MPRRFRRPSSLKKFHLPPGFEIQLVAAEPEVRKPINMNFDSRGRLYFTQSVEYPFPAKPGTIGRDTVKIIDGVDEHGHATQNQHVRRRPEHSHRRHADSRRRRGLQHSEYLSLHRSRATRAMSPSAKVLYGAFQYHDTHGMNGSFTRGLDGWIYANHGYTNDDTVVRPRRLENPHAIGQHVSHAQPTVRTWNIFRTAA